MITNHTYIYILIGLNYVHDHEYWFITLFSGLTGRILVMMVWWPYLPKKLIIDHDWSSLFPPASCGMLWRRFHFSNWSLAGWRDLHTSGQRAEWRRHPPRQRHAAPAERQAAETPGKRRRVHETIQCRGSGGWWWMASPCFTLKKDWPRKQITKIYQRCNA